VPRHHGERALCRAADGDTASSTRVHRALPTDRAILLGTSSASLPLIIGRPDGQA
jgi:hypothetical protein